MKNKIFIGICLGFLLIVSYFNWKFEVIAVHPFGCNGEYDFKVLTWNIHCSSKADIITQKRVAELILKEDADLIQLNEFTLDSCLVLDSILSKYYFYKEDVNAKGLPGDIFYSKRPLSESGKFNADFPNAIFSKLCLDKDSIYILGCHLVGNNNEGQIEIDDADSLRQVKTFWEHYRNAQEKRKCTFSEKYYSRECAANDCDG